MNEERVELVGTYWRCLALFDSGVRAERLMARHDWWAVERVEELVESGGTEAVQLVVDLALAAPDDVALSRLGAGPLEDLLHWRGEALLDEIEEAVRCTAVLRTALASVWYFAATPEVLQRLGKFGLRGTQP